MSVSVAGYAVATCSSVVTVRLTMRVMRVGPYHPGLLMVVSVVDQAFVQYWGCCKEGRVDEGGGMVVEVGESGLAEADLMSRHAPKTRLAS